jgi:hypothetical protein
MHRLKFIGAKKPGLQVYRATRHLREPGPWNRHLPVELPHPLRKLLLPHLLLPHPLVVLPHPLVVLLVPLMVPLPHLP